MYPKKHIRTHQFVPPQRKQRRYSQSSSANSQTESELSSTDKHDLMAETLSNLVLVHIGGFVEEWNAILNEIDIDDANDAEHANSMNCSDDISQELETVCRWVSNRVINT